LPAAFAGQIVATAAGDKLGISSDGGRRAAGTADAASKLPRGCLMWTAAKIAPPRGRGCAKDLQFANNTTSAGEIAARCHIRLRLDRFCIKTTGVLP
jgi:hypothetical protein